jgi:hypothetical protein
MMDSRGFRTAIRSVLLVAAVPDKPNEGIVALDKTNSGTLDVPAIQYRIEPSSYQIAERDGATGETREIWATCGVARFVDEVPGNGRDYVRSLLQPKMQQTNSVADWLELFLKTSGETSREDIMKTGSEHTFSEDQIKRAARKLNVVYRNEGIQRDGKLARVTWWALPGATG